MPHIKPGDRPGYKPLAATAQTAGELNFQLTVLVIQYLTMHGLSYQTCNDIVGALDNCTDEFRRLIQHPYEDKKRAENGDAYAEVIASLL